MKDEPCRFLQWDTKFFKYRIASANDRSLNQKLWEAIKQWCESNTIDCLYFLGDADDPLTMRIAEENLFRQVEIRITFEKWMEDWDPETRPVANEMIHTRPVREGDIPTLQEIAINSYPDSRFYMDTCFSEESCQRYYQAWIKKSSEGGADIVLVSEIDDQIIGYISANLEKDKTKGRFELTAVRPEYRRHGVGQELFRSMLDWCSLSGVEHVVVSTQGRNVSTQRMIQRHGFITKSFQLYYHKWFTDERK